MLKKTITYENLFTNEQVTEDHYFHISKADLIEMEMETHDAEYTQKDGTELSGMQAKLQRIIDSRDGKAILVEIKDMILRSYGQKVGERFVKTKEIRDDFASSEAFSQLLWELTTNAEAAAEFMNGIVPKNLDQIASEIRERAAEAQAAQALAPAEPTDSKVDPTGLTNDITPKVLTTAELADMDPKELQAGLADGRYKLS